MNYGLTFQTAPYNNIIQLFDLSELFWKLTIDFVSSKFLRQNVQTLVGGRGRREGGSNPFRAFKLFL